MLYMVIEYFNAGAAPEIYRRARERGRQLPPGLEYVSSWVDLDYFRCFQLMRTDERALFDGWMKAWSEAHLGGGGPGDRRPLVMARSARRAGSSAE